MLHLKHFVVNYIEIVMQQKTLGSLIYKEDIAMHDMVKVSEILDIINSILETSEITEKDINEDLSMLGMSSIMYISVVIAIEEKYNIEIPDEYLLNAEIGTVNKIFDIVTTVIEEKL